MKGDFRSVIVIGLACAGLWLLPSARRLANDDGRTEVARVLETDDSGLTRHGLVEYGTQRLRVELSDGRRFAAENELRAIMELDKKFAPGDRALVVVPPRVGTDAVLVARDHWRLGWAAAFFAAFCVFLCIFGGWTGLKALMSFVFSCLAVWKLLIPLALAGWHPSLVCLFTVSLLTAAIMYLVAGWTRKGLAAFLGAMLGVALSMALAWFFGKVMHVNGATMPYAQQLLYSGFGSLDLADVFVGATVLAASGAVMDLAMDIAAGVDEVVRHNSDLGFRELFASGVRLGRAVVGTMTTTLLLAYSGGFLTLLMVFAAQGTRVTDFLNSTLVGAELVKTLVGSFGLVSVAPFTAWAAAWLESRQTRVSRK